MLWYKNWRDSMPMVILLAIIYSPALTSSAMPKPAQSHWYGAFGLMLLFGFMFLAGSGIHSRLSWSGMRPSSNYSLLYTLSLPVSRRRLLLTRAAVGLLEMALISVVFSLLILWIHSGKENVTVPVMIAMLVKALAFGTGMYFVSTFVSVFLSGAYHLAAAYILSAVIVTCSKRIGPLSEYLNVGDAVYRTSVELPWVQMSIYVALGAFFLWASIKAVESREF